MAEDIKVSVLTATYNHENYIRHTIESVIAQKTNFKFELIIGDDCSTDKTGEIVREYADKYPDIIVPIIREKNVGMAMNTMDLMAKSKGEYIAFVEGDDYWIDANKLQKQVDFLESHRDYVAVFGTCIMVDENENRLENYEKYNGFMKAAGDYTVKDFETYLLPGQTATAMYRKGSYGMLQKKLQETKIDPRMMIDRTQVLCMLAVGKMYNLGENLAAYRYVLNAASGSWSSKNDFYNVENTINYLEGMKVMENIAKALDLDLNFDKRRLYEWDKLYSATEQLPDEGKKAVKEKIKSDFNNKSELFIFRLKRFLGKGK